MKISGGKIVKIKGGRYTTIYGVEYHIHGLTSEEVEFLELLVAIQEEFDWVEFSTFWQKAFDRRGFKNKSVLYRICKDMTERMGVSIKFLALPNIPDHLHSYIIDQFGSLTKFCGKYGFDIEKLAKILDQKESPTLDEAELILTSLGYSLTVVLKTELFAKMHPQKALEGIIFDTDE